MMKIAIYEDEKSVNFYPLTYLKPVYELRCGIFSLKEKYEKLFGKKIDILLCRDYLTDSLKERHADAEINPTSLENTLLINGRVLVNKKFRETVLLEGDEEIFMCNDTVVAVRIKSKKQIYLNDLNRKLFEGFKVSEFNADIVEYPWDLIRRNGDEIVNDSSYCDLSISGKIFEGAYLLNRGNISIGGNTIIKPGVVLDAENGPIIIGNNVTILPNAVVEGPCYIGDDSKIKISAKIYENTSIGQQCKIGGEVEESIIHSYSNKQHDGFLGHSYIGSWVNLGADTNNSDLKNNYGNVKVTINGSEIDSGMQFIGIIMGDHSKSGINTMFNTGTVIGISSNIFGGDFPPKVIPSFSWGGSKGFTNYNLEKAIEVAKIVTARRNMKFTKTDEELFKTVFKMTR